MKKIDPAILRETRYIAVWVAIFSAIMQAVFLVIGYWDYTVLLGNTLSGIIGILNFFLMGLAVQAAVLKEEKDAATTMKASQSLRMVMLFAIAAVGVLLPCFNTIAVLVPFFFPRIAVALRPLFNKNNEKKDQE